MRKNAGFTIMTLLLLIVPALANAWTLTVKVAGGTAAQPAQPAFVQYSTTSNVAAKTNLKIGTNYLYPKRAIKITAPDNSNTVKSKQPDVLLNGASKTLDYVNNNVKSGPNTVTLTYLTEDVIYKSVTVAPATGGMIYAKNLNNTWSTSDVSGYVQGADVPVTISADGNYKITGYYDGDTLVPVTPVAPATTVKVKSLTVKAQGQTVRPVFVLDVITSATLFAPTNGTTTKAVNCSATATSNDTGIQYAFAVTGPASFNRAASSTQTFSFTPAIVGTYTVTATVTSANGGSTTASANVNIADFLETANSSCVSCHSTQPAKHDYTNLIHTCAACHSDAPHSATPLLSGTVCADCHVPAPPHYGGTAFLKAQYLSAASLPISCADCHVGSGNMAANQAILAQFAGSAHADPAGEAWIHYDWRSGNRSACARCHTSTAFVAKLGNENNTSNVFQSGDILKPGEALACSACHTDAGTGELRTAAQDFAQDFTINMRNGATVTYDVAGASTLCARCHSGRETGASIKADPDTTGVRGFVDSHYQPAAGTLYNKAGYEYAGQDYNLGSHKLLGAASQGPCVACHMPGKNHTFVAASCGTCHGVTAPVLTASKATYDAALNDLKLALQAKGIHYGPVHPFFFTAPYVADGTNAPFTNWASVYGAGSWKDTMGAAFNYNLLWSEKGAFAHNYGYAMKLIADSIDFISDGTVDGP